MPKRLLVVLGALAGVLAMMRRTRARQAEQELWAEATKPIDLR